MATAALEIDCKENEEQAKQMFLRLAAEFKAIQMAISPTEEDQRELEAKPSKDN